MSGIRSIMHGIMEAIAIFSLIFDIVYDCVYTHIHSVSTAEKFSIVVTRSTCWAMEPTDFAA
jgi:hypothetical protein